MLSLSQCFDFTDLMPEEIILGVSSTPHHERLLRSYELALDRSSIIAVRDRMIADLRFCIDFGAKARAADLLLVLRTFLSQHLETVRKMEQESEPSRSLSARTPSHEFADKCCLASTAAVIAANGVLCPAGDVILFPFGHTRAKRTRRMTEKLA